MGQGGNVSEWEESPFELGNNRTESARGYRGGFWFNVLGSLSSSSRSKGEPTNEFGVLGFRVASIPEPSTLLLGALGGLGLLRRRT